MNTLQIESYGVTELSNNDTLSVDGGGWKEKLWDYTIGYVVGEIIDGVGKGLAEPCPCRKDKW